jgi:hypothetical protein
MVIDHASGYASGYGKCTFTRKDARNHIDKHRKIRLKPLLGNDALILMGYFDQKKQTNTNFWYSYSFTKQGRLKNIISTDGRGHASYKYFNDISVLDSI